MNTAEWLNALGSNARANTLLLECCGWDEDECEALLARLAFFLTEFKRQHPDIQKNVSIESKRILYNNLRVGLKSIAREDQIDTIMEYLSIILDSKRGEYLSD